MPSFLFTHFSLPFLRSSLLIFDYASINSTAVKECINVWKHVPRSALWLFVVQTFIMFGFSLTSVMNAIYATETLGIPKEQWWLTFIPLLITMVAASIPIGEMVDTVERKAP